MPTCEWELRIFMANTVKYSNNLYLESLKTGVRQVDCMITLNGNVVAANITTGTNMPGGVICYAETSGQPTPDDPGANFGTLDSNAAPSTVGILIFTSTAKRIVDIQVPTLGIISSQMTAGVVTLAGNSNTGVTASGNIAFVVSCTTLQLDFASVTHTFPIIVKYLPNGNTI